MPGSKCTVCEHEHRESIDKLLADGSLSHRTIANQFKLHRQAIDRHQLSHLTARIAKVAEKRLEKQDDAFMDGILNGMSAAKRGVDHGMSKASEVSAELAYRLAPGFLAQQARYLELLGQATGRLTTQPAGASSINLVVVMPRDLAAASQPELEPAIDCQVIPDPDTTKE